MVPMVTDDIRDQASVEDIINRAYNAYVYQLNPDEIFKDGATVEAFKRYLDSKLLNDYVQRYEYGNTVIVTTDDIPFADSFAHCAMRAAELELQPWYDRYFTRVLCYEEGSKDPEDITASRAREGMQGRWETDVDDFYPKE